MYKDHCSGFLETWAEHAKQPPSLHSYQGHLQLLLSLVCEIYWTGLILFRVLNWSSQAWGPGAELAACGQGWVLIQGFDKHKPQKPDSLSNCIVSPGPRDGRIRLQESRLVDTSCQHHLAGVTQCQSCVQAAGEVGVLTGHSQKSRR